MHRLTKLSRSIAGKAALVTGAAGGMGRATAHLFADEGARVAVCDVRPDGVEQVVEEIVGAGGDAHGWVLDVSDTGRVAAVVREVAQRFGGLDILINNAGVPAMIPIDGEPFEAVWAKTFAVNLSGAAHMIRAALPHLLRSGAGRIVNIASTEGLGATPLGAPYTASKHGLIGLTRSLAVELGGRGITVNCVCPGPIHTAMTAATPEEVKAKFARRRIPLRRYGEPEEVAQMTLSLVLPAASYTNGAVVVVDGGLRVQNV